MKSYKLKLITGTQNLVIFLKLLANYKINQNLRHIRYRDYIHIKCHKQPVTTVITFCNQMYMISHIKFKMAQLQSQINTRANSKTG